METQLLKSTYNSKILSNKVADGYGFNIKEMDVDQSERFYEVITKIITMIRGDN